jgi:hypothetical protein
MKNRQTNKNSIAESLADVAQKGIRADTNRLAEDMTCQFKDHREWIREYVVNAYDAQARTCWVSGTEEDDRITIRVEDDGHGMGREAVQSFFFIYRSIKQGDQKTAVGRHGIGKLSAAAIPGQCGFRMTTSTGTECWRVETGRLLDNAPIRLERVDPVPRPGTRFDITFKKTLTLDQELHHLHDVLVRYVEFLPLEILIFLPGQDGLGPPSPLAIRGDWYAGSRGARFFDLELGCNTFHVAVRTGSGQQAIYQNRVFITDSYSLTGFDTDNHNTIPYLDILVDSPNFHLPFGRHCLRDEDILKPLARELRQTVLPSFFGQLAAAHEQQRLDGFGLSLDRFEQMAVGLMCLVPDGPWAKLPVFNRMNGSRISLASLREKKTIYLDDGKVAGVDYSVFPDPVMSAEQPIDGLSLLQQQLKDRIIDLATKDLVLEAPAHQHKPFGEREKKLERHLRFHSNAVRMSARTDDAAPEVKPRDVNVMPKLFGKLGGVCEEAKRAQDDMESIHFRVGYLVQRDGKTPNNTHRFLVRNDDVLLNLHHPEVQQLLQVSDVAPALAGNWGLALCLTESKGILPHLTPAAREDLILWDAMSKVGSIEWTQQTGKCEEEDPSDDELLDFLLNARSRS